MAKRTKKSGSGSDTDNGPGRPADRAADAGQNEYGQAEEFVSYLVQLHKLQGSLLAQLQKKLSVHDNFG
jgi:hypothetical protein